MVARVTRIADFTYHGDDQKRRDSEKVGLIAPGDIGYLDEDGFLYLCDRAKDMVISGGVNIYPAEIEAELHKMPGVADCAVFGIPDEEYGEAICAVVQTQPGQRLTEADVRSICAGAWRATRCPSASISHPICRARIRARSSNASCVSPIGQATKSGSTRPKSHSHVASMEFLFRFVSQRLEFIRGTSISFGALNAHAFAVKDVSHAPPLSAR